MVCWDVSAKGDTKMCYLFSRGKGFTRCWDIVP